MRRGVASNLVELAAFAAVEPPRLAPRFPANNQCASAAQRLTPGGGGCAHVVLRNRRHCRRTRKIQELCRMRPAARFPGASPASRRKSGCRFLWPRAGPSASAEGASVPTPIASFNLRKVQVNTVLRHSERIVEQFADLLRQLAVHFAGQAADAADVYKGCVT